MDLIDIIKQQAEYSRNSSITVVINSPMSWVTIENTNSGAGVFLQGDDADEFIAKVDTLSEQLPDVDFDTLELAVAYEYVDMLGEM